MYIIPCTLGLTKEKYDTFSPLTCINITVITIQSLGGDWTSTYSATIPIIEKSNALNMMQCSIYQRRIVAKTIKRVFKGNQTEYANKQTLKSILTSSLKGM